MQNMTRIHCIYAKEQNGGIERLINMTLGERIKEKRKEQGISVEILAEKLGVSYTTVYRYENSSIEKIPVSIFDNMCKILNTTPGELMGNESNEEKEKQPLPNAFKTAQEAMEFVLRIPSLAAFGGYDPYSMDDATIVEFANEILQQLKLVSYKYRTNNWENGNEQNR